MHRNHRSLSTQVAATLDTRNLGHSGKQNFLLGCIRHHEGTGRLGQGEEYIATCIGTAPVKDSSRMHTMPDCCNNAGVYQLSSSRGMKTKLCVMFVSLHLNELPCQLRVLLNCNTSDKANLVQTYAIMGLTAPSTRDGGCFCGAGVLGVWDCMMSHTGGRVSLQVLGRS